MRAVHVLLLSMLVAACDHSAPAGTADATGPAAEPQGNRWEGGFFVGSEIGIPPIGRRVPRNLKAKIVAARGGCALESWAIQPAIGNDLGSRTKNCRRGWARGGIQASPLSSWPMWPFMWR